MTQKTESALQKTATPSAARRRRNARAAATPTPPIKLVAAASLPRRAIQ